MTTLQQILMVVNMLAFIYIFYLRTIDDMNIHIERLKNESTNNIK